MRIRLHPVGMLTDVHNWLQYFPIASIVFHKHNKKTTLRGNVIKLRIPCHSEPVLCVALRAAFGGCALHGAAAPDWHGKP